MKFSIATLLILMLASAFSMLAWRSYQSIEDIDAQVLDLQNQIVANENKYLRAKHRLDLFEQFESKPLTTDARAEAAENFRTLQQRYGALEIKDPSKPAVVTYPLPTTPADALHKQFRVFVPQDQKIELAGFVKDRKGKQVDVDYFRPNQFALPLPQGESVIDFRYSASGGNGLRDSIVVKVLGGDVRQEITYVQLERSLSTTTTHIPKQYEPFKTKSYMRLVSMTHFKNRSTDTMFNLVIRQVNQED